MDLEKLKKKLIEVNTPATKNTSKKTVSSASTSSSGSMRDKVASKSKDTYRTRTEPARRQALSSSSDSVSGAADNLDALRERLKRQMMEQTQPVVHDVPRVGPSQTLADSIRRLSRYSGNVDRQAELEAGASLISDEDYDALRRGLQRLREAEMPVAEEVDTLQQIKDNHAYSGSVQQAQDRRDTLGLMQQYYDSLSKFPRRTYEDIPVFGEEMTPDEVDATLAKFDADIAAARESGAPQWYIDKLVSSRDDYAANPSQYRNLNLEESWDVGENVPAFMNVRDNLAMEIERADEEIWRREQAEYWSQYAREAAEKGWKFTEDDYAAFRDRAFAEQGKSAAYGVREYKQEYTYDEAYVYQYVLENYGQTMADEYESYLQPMVAERANEANLEAMNLKDKSFLYNAVGSTMFGLGKIENAIDVKIQLLDKQLSGSDRPVDYHTTGGAGMFSNAMREENASRLMEHGDINDWLGTDIPFLEGIGLDTFYNAGQDFLNSVVNGLVFGKSFAGAAMSLEKYSDEFVDAQERGLPDSRADRYATASAFAEGLGETVGIFSFLSTVGGIGRVPGWKAKVGLGILQTIEGGIGEGLTTVAEQTADKWFAGKYSQFNLRVNELINAGYSPEQAQAIAQNEAEHEIFVSILMGVVGQGVPTAVGGTISNTVNTHATGAAIRDLDNADMLTGWYNDVTGKNNKTPKTAAGIGRMYNRLNASADKYIRAMEQAEMDEAVGTRYEQELGSIGPLTEEQRRIRDMLIRKGRGGRLDHLDRMDVKKNAPKTLTALNEFDIRPSREKSTAARTKVAASPYLAQYPLAKIKETVEKAFASESKTDAVSGTTEAAKERAESRKGNMNIDATAENTTVGDETVTVQGIGKVIENEGEATVKVVDSKGNTREVAMNEITFNDPHTYDVYSYAQDMATPELAQAFIDTVDSTTEPIEYVQNGMNHAYDMALNGYTNIDTVRTSPMTTGLSKQQLQIAFDMGVKDRAAQIAAKAERARKRQQASANKRWQSGRIIMGDVVMEGLSEEQKRDLDIVDVIAKVFGINIELFESKADKGGNYQGERGSYDPKTNTIRLDVRAGINKVGDSFAGTTMLKTVAHELTHSLQRNSLQKYEAYKNAVLDVLEKNGQVIEEMVDARMAEDSSLKSPEDAIDEIVADASETMLRDSNLMDRLQELHPEEAKTFIQKVLDLLKRIKDAIREAFEGVELSKEAQAIMSDIDRLAAQWSDIAVEAAEVSGREASSAYNDTVGIFDEPAQPAEAHIDQRNWKDVGDRSVNAFLNDYKYARAYMGNAADVLLADLNASVPGERYQTPDGEWVGQKRQTSDTIAYMLDNGMTWDSVRSSLEKIFQTMYAGDVENDIPNTAAIKRTELMLDEMLSNGYTTLDGTKFAADAGYIEYKNALPGAMANAIPEAAEGSVEFDSVRFSTRRKQTDTPEFKKWFADSKVVNPDGTPKVMYHGSPANFTVFDIKKAKSSGLYGKGFYFTDSASHGSTYGKLYEVYLSIQNPLTPGGNTVTRAQVRKFLEAVSENEDDYSIENYGTYDIDEILSNVYRKDAFSVIQDVSATAIGDLVEAAKLFNEVNGTKFDGIVVDTETVAFEPTQIKSATDNIGTFNPDNPDIRYSSRRADNISDRELLANVLTGAVQNETERRLIEEYQDKLNRLEAEQSRLDTARATIRELAFKPSSQMTPEDRQRLDKAREDAKKLATSLARADKSLLKLQAMEPLKNVLARAREYAKDRLRDEYEQKIRDARLAERMHEGAYTAKLRGLYEQRMTDLRARKDAQMVGIAEKNRKDRIRMKEGFEQRLTDLRARKDAQILRTREQRESANLRKTIVRRASNLDKLLRNPTDKRHLPEGLRKPVLDLMEVFTGIDKAFGGGEHAVAKLNECRNAYERMRNEADNPNGTSNIVASKYTDAISKEMEILADAIKELGNGDIYDLAPYDLRRISSVLDHFEFLVREGNKEIINGKRVETGRVLSNIFDQMYDESTGRPKYGAGRSILQKMKLVGDTANGLHISNLTPVYFSRMMGGQLGELMDSIINADATFGLDYHRAQDRLAEIRDEFDYDSWAHNNKELLTITAENGAKLKLTREQALCIWATDKRERGSDIPTSHLALGGVIFDEKAAKSNFNGEVTETTGSPLSRETLTQINDWLTEKQKRYADAMVAFVSNDMARLGNETSMELHGYKKFREGGYYFPFRTPSDFIRKEAGRSIDVAMYKNEGFTKPLQKGASTPVLITDFSDAIANHVERMCKYNALAVPQDTLQRILNYKAEKNVSVESLIRGYYGSGDAVDYMRRFLSDIHDKGRGKPEAFETLGGKLASMNRRGSVLGSASVAIQQPSALARAMAMINLRHFRKPVGSLKAFEEAKKYSGVCVLKDMGGFDAGTSVSSTDWLLGRSDQWIRKHGTKKDAAAQLLNKAVSIAPEIADKLTWGELWNTVKREQAYETGLDINSEELKQIAGKRMDEVCRRTQVYDSVMAKSQVMRNEGRLKQYTSFMAEPTVTYNMVADAMREGLSGHPKAMVGTMAAVLVGIIYNNALKSIVLAGRDDDDEKAPWGERWFRNFMEGNINDVVILNYVPIARDVWSMLMGYDVERPDASVINKGLALIVAIADENKSVDDKLYSASQVLGTLTPVPIGNIWRDLRAVKNTFFKSATSDNEWRDNWSKYAMRDAVTSNTPLYRYLGPSDAERLYNAALEGDDAAVAEQRQYMIDYKNKDDKQINSSLRSEIKKGYIRGDVGDERAIKMLTTYTGMSTGDAEDRVLEWSSERDTGIAYGDMKDAYLAGDISEEEVTAARMKYGGADESTANSTADQWRFEKDTGIAYSDMQAAYIAGEISRQDAINYRVKYGGKNRDDAEADVLKWDCEKDTGIPYDELKDEYINGNVTRKAAENYRVKYGGKDREDAEADVAKWDYEKKFGHPYTDMKSEYLAGNITYQQAVNARVKYGGVTEKTARRTVDRWDDDK